MTLKDFDLFTNKIKEEAEKLGFIKIGFSNPEILETNKFLREWIDAGFCGEMKWIEKSLQKRNNPKFLYPEVKTIISAAISYFCNFEHKNIPGFGKISRYAQGEDYHNVVKEKLKKLLNFIKKEKKNADGRIYVDSAPVMEKIWAAKSGLGWVGKNSLLITREAGSWIFLGEIFLNFELKTTETVIRDFCGSSEKCIKVCPTGAIVKSRVVNSEKCISYQTIENKGEIPESLRNKIGCWIYGCDICQEVCPWNKFSKETTEKRFLPEKINLNLDYLSNISEARFKKQFQKSPINRIKFSGFKRNVKIAVDNLL